MNLQHLRYFLAVMRTGSVSRAADELGVTQPTLSQALKGLEREFGTALFAPDGRGIRPLPGALKLEPRARLALQTLADAKRELAGPAPGALKLGLLPSLAARWLAPVIGPEDGRFEIVEAASDELEKRVADGGLDLALSVAPKRDGLARRVLLREPFQLFVAADHPWSGRRSIALAELDRQPFVLRQGCEMLGTGKRLLAAAGVKFHIVAKTQQEATAATLVGAHVGCTLAPAGWGTDSLRGLDVAGLKLARQVALLWKTPAGAKAAAQLAARLPPRG